MRDYEKGARAYCAAMGINPDGEDLTWMPTLIKRFLPEEMSGKTWQHIARYLEYDDKHDAARMAAMRAMDDE